MRLSGKQIVDVSVEDARELRAYADGMARGYMNHTRRPAELLAEFQKNNPRQSAMSNLVDFMSMVALALADAPKNSPTVNVEPFKGILADVTSLPAPNAVGSLPVAIKTLYEPLWTILGAQWPDRGEYQIDYHKTSNEPARTEEVPYLGWAIERLLASEGAVITYTCDGSGVTIAVKRGNLVRVIEAGHETHVWDLDHPERGDLYATTRPTADDAVKEQSKPVHPRYTFTSGRDLWNRLAEAHAVNGNYYVRKQKFDSLQGACEHFWTLLHTRPNESHYLCEHKTDGIVASHVNGRTKVIVVEDAVIPAEVCV